MATLLEQLQSLTSGSSLELDIGAQAGQFGQILGLVRQFSEQPPGDFAGYLGQMRSLSLPNVSLGGALQQSFGQLLPDLQGELGGQVQPLLDAAGSLQGELGGGLGEALVPLLEVVGKLRDLLAADWSCGLVESLAPPAVAPPAAPDPGPGPAPDPAPAAAGVLATTQVERAKSMIASLPPEMTVPDLLLWLHAKVGTWRPDYFPMRAIPLLDDLRDPLDSLARWNGFDGGQLAAELAQTLSDLGAILRANTAARLDAPFAGPGVAAALATFPDLGAAGGQLADALAGLGVAAAADNGVDLATHLAAAQAAAIQVEAANASLDGRQADLAALEARLRGVGFDLETAICRLLVLLQPRAAWGDLSGRLGGVPPTLDEQVFAPLTELIDRLREFLENLLGLLDVASVTQPVADVLNRAGDSIQRLDQGLAQLTAGARAQFQLAHDALAGLDMDAVAGQADAALNAATLQVQHSLEQGLAPAAAALGGAFAAVEGALAGFDPEQLGAPVRQVMDGLKAVLEDAAVQQAIQSLQQLKRLAEQLDQLTFRPVGDVVVGGIGEVKSALDAIDESNLPAPMPDMIAEAMSILPASLTPLTDPLISGLDELIDQGPIPLLEGLRDLPKPIVEHLNTFSPRGLLEEPLGAPFKALRDGLDEFEPGHWLDVADQELDGLKARIAESLDLQPLLAPIAQAQQALVDELGRLRPGAVIEPLTSRLEEALRGIATALPTSQLTEALDGVLLRVARITASLDQVVDLTRTLATQLGKLGDPDAQLNDWLDAILDKLPADAPATLGVPLAALAQAVENAHAAPMRAAWQAARQPLADRLAAADAQALLTRWLRGKSALTPVLLAGVSPSPTRDALQTWLAAFDPAAPAFSRGARRLARLGEALAAADAGLETLFADWDARYLRADGLLAALDHEAVTLIELRTWLREGLDRQLGAPVVGFLKQLKGFGALLHAFAAGIAALIQAVRAKLDAVMAVPQALSNAAHDLAQFQAHLAGLDLGLFAREVDSLHQQLIARLRALDPRDLEAPLRKSLEKALDAISLDAVFTPALRQQLQQDYASLRAKIEALDPELLVIQPLDDLYTRDLLPLVEAIDVSEAVQKLIDRLNDLPDELKGELGRVDSAYQAMLAAAPSGGASGASASVSVG